MKVVAFLPAKGSSERIESKNMKLLNGKPLFLHTLEKLCSCEFIDEVYLDSESDEILNYASYLDYKPLKRDSVYASNKTDGHVLFYQEASKVNADIYIQILGTSPFVKKETIKKGIDILKNKPEYDSVVLVRKEKQYQWDKNGPCYDRFHIPNSIDLPDTIIEGMALYIVRKDVVLNHKMRFGNNVYLLEADPIEYIDVNFPEDFAFAELVAYGIHAKECAKLQATGHFFNSSIFADILADMGIHSTLSGYKLNLPQQKIWGRANTLRIRKLNPNEDFSGIYSALKTYDKIVSGDIIVVENEMPNHAYFGELNANLAIRSGAIGAIIGGVTRDVNEVTALGFPVFAKGYSPIDVRKQATLDYHNRPITIDGVKICPGDLIFADVTGCVVIPKKLERHVITKAIESIKTEKNVLTSIFSGNEAFSIYTDNGAF